MIKICRSKALLFFIISAFLAVQWSNANAHIHLAAHHDHDGWHHQHASKGHLHAWGSHHTDAVDVAHVDEHKQAVELERECATPSWKKQDNPPEFPISVNYSFHLSHQPVGNKGLSVIESASSWLAYATVLVRAPPHRLHRLL